ncbi:hypothetical protein L1987_04598 [Smallanthus sonchifolius]|uniref:Uncharacterized protein n=1 Tax=Smallanthus sonchifolius TaxID=185202 RepID=A0ACB9JT07_9ASTR|nr:hypothetical protein L1987_04598 [Smallanthus sonchifolius]
MRNNICHKFLHLVLFIFPLILPSLKITTATPVGHESVAGRGVGIYKCIDNERHALLDFKSYIDQDPDDLLSTWTTDEKATNDCCNWSGVICNDQTGHVTSLDLSLGDLEGKISPSLLNLSYLNYLDLHENSFNGAIPMFIGSMTQLRYLDLSYNSFTGPITPALRNLTNLQEFLLNSLSNCTIENIDWLSHMSHLHHLELDGISLGKASQWSKSWNNNLNSTMYHWLFPLTSNRHVDLDLSSNKLDGIPKYLGNLCSLTSLLFDNNSIPVKFPGFLNNLSGCTSVTLQELYASNSQFTGSLSDDIQKFSSLKELFLFHNQLNGTISEKVWQLPKLVTLDVSYNYLRGAISENIGNSKILNLKLSNNSLEGVTSEAHMSNLSNANLIDLSSCKLGPGFPKWIQTLKNLTYLDIANNKISDTIPVEFWNTWPSLLTHLNISSNNISGKVNDLLSNFNPNYVSKIDLSSNNFYGPIPYVPSNSEWLDLSKNKFYGGISFLCQVVDGYLSYLDLSNNLLTGQIPDCLWNFKALKVLNLGQNNLSGRLPTSIKFLINLEVLYLYKNNFSGELPLSLKNCTKLIFLELGSNKFTGYVPAWVGENLSELYALSLASNNFFGTIPLQLCELVQLRILDLSVNNLYGTIPLCINNLTGMVQDGLSPHEIVHRFIHGQMYIDRLLIKWRGCVREFNNNLGLLKYIDLSRNNLTGELPYGLTDLHKLIALNLSMNALFGEIPLKIGQMRELQILDLSRNKFSGRMPLSMSQMTSLDYLDVSGNKLSGRIPSSTKLQSFEPSRYTGNAGLCGPPLTKYCPGDKELEASPFFDGSEGGGEGIVDLQRWFYIGGATGFATGFWIACGALLVNRRGRNFFFHFLDSLKDRVFVKVTMFAKWQ